MKTYSDQIYPGVSFPSDALPSLQMKHIDGPYLHFRDGQMHWLTWRERFRVWWGTDNAESLERKLRPNLMRTLRIS